MNDDQQTAPIDVAHKDESKLPLSDGAAASTCCTADDVDILQFLNNPTDKNKEDKSSRSPGREVGYNGNYCAGPKEHIDYNPNDKNKMAKFEFEDLFDGLNEGAANAPAAASDLDGQRPFSCRRYEKGPDNNDNPGHMPKDYGNCKASTDSSSISRLKSMLELPADECPGLSMRLGRPGTSRPGQSVLVPTDNPSSDKKGSRSYDQTVDNVIKNGNIPSGASRDTHSEDASAELPSSKPSMRASRQQDQPMAAEIAAYEPMAGEFARETSANYANSMIDPRYRKRRYVEDRLFSVGQYRMQDGYPRNGYCGWNDGYRGGMADYMGDYRTYGSGPDGSFRNGLQPYPYQGQSYSNWSADGQAGTYAPQAGNGNQMNGADLERDHDPEYSNYPDAMGHLYRQPYDTSSFGPFYGFRKKRRNNPSLWNMSQTKREMGQSMPPSKYSSLEFVQGMVNRKAFLGTPPHVPEKPRNNYMLPTIIESSRPLNSEQAGIVRSFKAEVIQLDLENITVFQLKSLMKEYGLNHSGKKSELIEIVKEAYSKTNKFDLAQPDSPPGKAEQPINKGLEYDKYFF